MELQQGSLEVKSKADQFTGSCKAPLGGSNQGNGLEPYRTHKNMLDVSRDLLVWPPSFVSGGLRCCRSKCRASLPSPVASPRDRIGGSLLKLIAESRPIQVTWISSPFVLSWMCCLKYIWSTQQRTFQNSYPKVWTSLVPEKMPGPGKKTTTFRILRHISDAQQCCAARQLGSLAHQRWRHLGRDGRAKRNTSTCSLRAWSLQPCPPVFFSQGQSYKTLPRVDQPSTTH